MSAIHVMDLATKGIVIAPIKHCCMKEMQNTKREYVSTSNIFTKLHLYGQMQFFLKPSQEWKIKHMDQRGWETDVDENVNFSIETESKINTLKSWNLHFLVI